MDITVRQQRRNVYQRPPLLEGGTHMALKQKHIVLKVYGYKVTLYHTTQEKIDL